MYAPRNQLIMKSIIHSYYLVSKNQTVLNISNATVSIFGEIKVIINDYHIEMNLENFSVLSVMHALLACYKSMNHIHDKLTTITIKSYSEQRR